MRHLIKLNISRLSALAVVVVVVVAETALVDVLRSHGDLGDLTH